MKKKKQTGAIINGELFLHSKHWLQMCGLCSLGIFLVGIKGQTESKAFWMSLTGAILYYCGGVLLMKYNKKKLLKQQEKGSEQFKEDAL